MNKIKVNGVGFNLKAISEIESFDKFKETHSHLGLNDEALQKAWDEGQTVKSEAKQEPVIVEKPKGKKRN